MGESAVRDRIQQKSGWLIQKQLGRGQYGTAYLVGGGNSEDVDEQAVAKVVGLEFLPEKEHKVAFQEVDLMRQLQHPHIVMLVNHFFTEANLELVIVMEYCDQGDLRGEVKKRAQAKPISRIEEPHIMRWLVQLTLALNYIHQRHILHRDLKSSNIFMTTSPDKDGLDVKIGDFGISRVLEGTVDVAATVVGTPYYMSPEVCKAEPYGYKSDIWALGCVLYEMCMLKHAFESQSLLGLVYKIVSETYDPIPPEYSHDLRNVLERVLDKSHFSRPTGKELLEYPYVKKFVPSPFSTEGGGATSMNSNTSINKVSAAAQSRAPLGTTLNPQKKPQRSGMVGSGAAMRMPEPVPPQPDAALAIDQVVKHGAVGSTAPDEQVRRRWNAPPGGPTAPSTAKQLDEDEFRAQVLLGRIKRALAVRRQNWLQVFASFDHVGDGRLPEAEFDRAVTSMALGLSDQEIREVRRYLLVQSGGNCVPVDLFGKAITGTSPEVQRAEAWGRTTLMEVSREASKAAGGTNSVSPGAAVRVQGLQSAVGVKLNGSEGIVKEWDAQSCRWVVKLERGELKSIRDEHLLMVRPAPNAGGGGSDGGRGSDTTAIYRLLCEGGETAVPEANFLGAIQSLLPKLGDSEKRKLLLLLPKSSDGRIDVAEVLAQFLVGNVGDQSMHMGGPYFAGHAGLDRTMGGPQAGPGPDFRDQASPSRAPVMRPSPPQRRTNTSPSPAPPAASRGPAPNGMPGSLPSPHHDASPKRPGKESKTFGRGGSGPSAPNRVNAEVALLRLAQKLLGRPAAPGPGADLLRLFAARPDDLRVEELCEAVSVSPLSISRAEVQCIFSHLSTGNHKVLPWAQLAAALQAAYNAGTPSEAAALEGLDLARVSMALQRLDSTGGCGRYTIQEFRVTLMQAEPYLTANQLEWLMLLTDKDGEGRLLPRSLLGRLGLGAANANRGGQLIVPPRPAGSSRTPVAPHTPRSQVVAAIIARIRDKLFTAGPQLTLEHVFGIFEMGTERGVAVSRETLACLIGHMHLGVSVMEADELVSSIATATGGATPLGSGNTSVKLSSLYETVNRAGDADVEALVDELREICRDRFLGRGNQFASAAATVSGPRSEGGDWLPETEFRRCLTQALIEDGSPTKPPDSDEEEKAVLLAEKNAAGYVRWRHFAAIYLGWMDDEYRSDPGSNYNQRQGLSQQTWQQQTWRSGKTVPERTVIYSAPKDPDSIRMPVTLKVVTEPEEKKGGACRCLAKLFGGQA